MVANFWAVLRGILLVALGVGLIGLISPQPALASIHTYHEQPGQTTHRSRQSLRDQNDLAWQATVFRRYFGDQLQGTYLRLVGFPGRVKVEAEGSLSVQTGTARQWNLPSLPADQVAVQTKELPETWHNTILVRFWADPAPDTAYPGRSVTQFHASRGYPARLVWLRLWSKNGCSSMGWE
ncbi:MAG: DUF3122 domain-containing protein [Leptolyngbyaceae cyanobacterium SM2_3_12]|nr:DUF3122 domain-containing protein [Leptolyngbyaceae cyanobacterium SM2_3_12]